LDDLPVRLHKVNHKVNHDVIFFVVPIQSDAVISHSEWIVIIYSTVAWVVEEDGFR